jgi:hypothetical protein
LGLDGWRLETTAGITLARCEALDGVTGVGHAFSTRRGPEGTDLDLAGPVDGRLAGLLGAFCDAAGLGRRPPALLRQVHGPEVLRGAALAEGSLVPADGLLALRSDGGTPIAVRAADCVPLLLCDERGRAVAAVHAGWRGIAAGVALRAVARLAEEGIGPADLLAALGPAIGPCCYEVGGDVLEAVAQGCGVPGSALARRAPGAAPRLDMRQAIRTQLLGAGLLERRIHRARWCTACERDLFFSHRRDGIRAGRHVAVIGWRGHAP